MTYDERVAKRRSYLRKMYKAAKSAKEIHGFVRFSKYDELCVKLQKTEVLRILRKRLAEPYGGTISNRPDKWSCLPRSAHEPNHTIFYFLG